jgi:protein-tyrosine kinase
MTRLNAHLPYSFSASGAADFDHVIAPPEGPPPLSAAELEERSLIGSGVTSRAELNAFRDLRTRLLAAGEGRSFVALVVPVSRGSGGSYVCRNLAAAFALDETKSAIVLDCNPFHPSQHTDMRLVPERGGLVDYLRNPDMDSRDIVYETGVPRLRLVPAGAGAESDGEYFSSPRMQLLLDTLRNNYPARYLFLDGPSPMEGPDARILSDLVDLVVLVAGYGRDSAAAIAQAATHFDPNKFAGVVLNQRP